MIEMHFPVDVPDDRRVTLTLPANVPTGSARLTVTVEPEVPSLLSANLPDVPRAFPPRPLNPKLAAEFDAFQKLLPSLLTNQRGRFVAIHNGQVVETGEDRGTVLTRAHKKTGEPMVYVEQVTDEPQVILRSGIVREMVNGKSG